MSRWTPCKRRDSFMVYESHRLAIPSNSEYSVDQVRMTMAEVEAILGRAVTAAEWTCL